MNTYVLGYDIADPKRLVKVHRILVKYASPIEYSVFLFLGTQTDLTRCLEEVTKIIKKNEDDFRCYPLPSRGLKERIGRAVLPQGITWTGLPSHWN